MISENVHIGTSGFYVQNLYPSDVRSTDKLAYYAQHFSTVEINSTFYQIPHLSTLRRWQEAVSQNFIFSFKVYKGITHAKEYSVDTDLLKKWFALFIPVFSNKRHCMLFQFPASFNYHQKYFESLLKNLSPQFQYAFEFRHPSWFTESILKEIQSNGYAVVFSSAPIQENKPLWPQINTSDMASSYLRFHGSTKLYYSSYTSAEIKNYETQIKKEAAKSKTVYAYFNNDAEGSAVSNARELVKLLQT